MIVRQAARRLLTIERQGEGDILDGVDSQKVFTKNVIETVIKIAVLGLLVLWTFQLVRPFLIPVLWGMILAVALDPFIDKVAKMLGGRKSLASVIFVLVVIATLVIPTVLLVMSSVDTVQSLSEQMHNKTLVVPPPPARVADWPLIGGFST